MPSPYLRARAAGVGALRPATAPAAGLRRNPAPLLFAVAAIWLVAIYIVADIRDGARETADRRISTQATIAALHIAQVVQAIGTSLQIIDMDPATPEIVMSDDRDQLYAQLQRSKNASAAIQFVAVTGADGRVLASDVVREASPIDVSDRPYFAAHRDSRDTALRFDRPVAARPDGRIAIPVTRRVETPDGRFAGVLVARVEPAYFGSFLRLIDASIATLATADGTVLARHPEVDLIAAPRIVLADRDVGAPASYFNSPVDGNSYLTKIVEVPGTGLMLGIGESDVAISAEWKRRSLAPVALAAAATLFLAGLAAFARQRENAILALRAATETVSRNKSEFLAHMSHEIRTPLNAILGFSEIISNDTMKLNVAARYRDYANDINFSAGHLLAVINQILDMAKVEAGKWELDESDISAATLAGAAARLAAAHADAEGVDIDTGGIDPDIRLRGDERTLRQLLLNLVVNAIKHAGADRRVTLSAVRTPDGGVVFAVADKGPGMAPADAARVLNPFETGRSDNARAQTDTGLGLPLARLFAELHGGRLTIESAPGQGTTVHFFLPAARVVA